MRRYIWRILIPFLCFSCAEAEIEIYNSPDGIYFQNPNSAYNFLENYQNKVLGRDTLYIPIEVSGFAVSYDREIIASVVRDSLLTAHDSMFMLLKGVVKADTLRGSLPIVIFYDEAMDDSLFVARIKLSANDFFVDQALNNKPYSVSFTNKISMPENWARVRSRLGTKYSNSWYSFILSEMEMSYIPYWNGPNSSVNPDPERYWMTSDHFNAYVSKIKQTLQDYNNSPKGPLLHEDGEFKGQPVTM